MQAGISVKGLSFCYPEEGRRDSSFILNGIDLEIAPGSFVAIAGENGSGKSTLVKHMNALLLPSGGTVLVDGLDTANPDLLLEIRRISGMVFQNPDNQMVASIVEEDVAFAPENLGLPAEEIRARVDHALKLVRMYEYRNHAPHLLSGGQKQRIAIAGIVAMRPRFLILDEPTAMLDPAGRAEVLDTIRNLNRTRGITVILITHHMEEAAEADRLILLKRGKIAADGAPRVLFQDRALLESAGLAAPDTVRLLWMLRQSGFDLPLNALSIEECTAALFRFLSVPGAPQPCGYP